MALQKAITTWPAGQNSATLSLVTGKADTLAGSVFADQPGTLFVEQSGDNANWDVQSSFPVTASTGLGFRVDALLAYARVRFVPTTTNPAVFRLFGRALAAGPQM
jgi:hypothetical protein